MECWDGMVLLKLQEDMQKLLVKNAAHSLMGLILISTRCYHWLPAEQCFTWVQSLRLRERTDEHSQDGIRDHWVVTAEIAHFGWSEKFTTPLCWLHHTKTTGICLQALRTAATSSQMSCICQLRQWLCDISQMSNTYKIFFPIFLTRVNFPGSTFSGTPQYHKLWCVWMLSAGSLLPGDKSSRHWFLPWNSNATFPVFTLWAKVFSVNKWEGSKAL